MRPFLPLFIVGALLGGASVLRAGGSRIKDLAMVAGARDNQLSGYASSSARWRRRQEPGGYRPNHRQSLATLWSDRSHLDPDRQKRGDCHGHSRHSRFLEARFPPRCHRRVDGDAKSLQGGVLVQTPLLGADGKVYAIAQGPLSIGGLSSGADGAGGAPCKRTIRPLHYHRRSFGGTGDSGHRGQRQPSGIAPARTGFHLRLPPGRRRQCQIPPSSLAVDSTTIRVRMPADWAGSAVDFISQVETLEIIPDIPARVIINERTGTIVATARIHISNCAVSHGNVTISIASAQDVSQPGAFSQGGTTQVTTHTDAKIKEDKGSMVALPELPTVEKVASALNALGVTPRDMMSMFEAMKEAGALQAELIMR